MTKIPPYSKEFSGAVMPVFLQVTLCNGRGGGGADVVIRGRGQRHHESRKTGHTRETSMEGTFNPDTSPYAIRDPKP